ncbi:hypothetical protein ACFRKB_38560 [Streptomyces scopuliridis]|uniref:hypothetical protein n=1 Tax=Streptomyces scopuliridis TaxID=452529 RepID=UPI0036A85C1A
MVATSTTLNHAMPEVTLAADGVGAAPAAVREQAGAPSPREQPQPDILHTNRAQEATPGSARGVRSAHGRWMQYVLAGASQSIPSAGLGALRSATAVA